MKKILISLLFVSISLWSVCIGDCANGHGTYIFSDGTKYVGEFKYNTWQGQGTLTFSNGDRYEGEWENGKKNGQGTYIFSDGRKYVGEWKNNDFDGQGTFTYANGSKDIGEWKNDILIKSNPPKKLKGYLEDDLTISMPDYKGYLEDDLIISLPDYEYPLEKGEYVEINIDLKKIIIPKGFETITLEEIPVLSVPANKRKINIESKIVKTINQDKKVIKFEINTNIKLKSIKCNNKKLSITNNDDYIYKTIPRALKNKYELKLISDKNEELIYDCDFNGCQKRKKGKL